MRSKQAKIGEMDCDHRRRCAGGEEQGRIEIRPHHAGIMAELPSIEPEHDLAQRRHSMSVKQITIHLFGCRPVKGEIVGLGRAVPPLMRRAQRQMAARSAKHDRARLQPAHIIGLREAHAVLHRRLEGVEAREFDGPQGAEGIDGRIERGDGARLPLRRLAAIALQGLRVPLAKAQRGEGCHSGRRRSAGGEASPGRGS